MVEEVDTRARVVVLHEAEAVQVVSVVVGVMVVVGVQQEAVEGVVVDTVVATEARVVRQEEVPSRAMVRRVAHCILEAALLPEARDSRDMSRVSE